MDEPTRKLGPRMRGEDVRMLHGGLLRLGATIAVEELIDSRFGGTTRVAVLEFQRSTDLPPTGIVEEATFDALRRALADRPAEFRVVGRVRHADGQPAVRVGVRAFDRDLRREQLLGESTTDPAGRYHVAYSPERFLRAAEGRHHHSDRRAGVRRGGRPDGDPVRRRAEDPGERGAARPRTGSPRPGWRGGPVLHRVRDGTRRLGVARRHRTGRRADGDR